MKVLTYTIIVVVIILIFLPLFSVNVVPEWSIRLIWQNGRPVPDAKVDEWWKDYSLEFWRDGRHVSESVFSDSDGNITFPARSIRVSLGEICVAKARDYIAQIDPHAGFGPYAFLLCRDGLNCSMDFRPGAEPPPKTMIVTK